MNQQLVICSHCCTGFNPDTLLVEVKGRVFCSQECSELAFGSVPRYKAPRSTRMTEQAKARLREVVERKRKLLMKHIDPVALLASCDAWDERGGDVPRVSIYDFSTSGRMQERRNGLLRWVPGRFIRRWKMRRNDYGEHVWCWLVHATPAQIEALRGRLPHRRITTVGFDHRRRQRIATNRVCFDFQTIAFILRHYGDVDLTKYVVAATEKFVTAHEIKENA